MKVLQDVGDLTVPDFQAFAQVRDHALHVGEHDVDRRRVRRFGDARRDIGRGRRNREPDQLPRRAEPAHHHEQRVEEDIAMPPDRRIEQVP